MKINSPKLCLLFPVFVLPLMLHAQTNYPGWEKGAGKYDLGADDPPIGVSELNGKISYAGGDMNSSEGHNVGGSIAFPIANEFGFQADGLFSHIGDDDFYGGAGHLFWRNPEIGLIGVTGGYLDETDVNTFQTGVEAEYYWKRFTFGAFAGVGSISYARRAPFIDTEPTRFVGKISANYYVIDDLRLGVSYMNALENSLVLGEVEYQTPIRGLALTGEIACGDHGYDHWLLGVRYYFGSKKSLIDRQRQDDPPSLMPQILSALGLYGAEFNHKADAYFANRGGGGSDSSYGVILTTIDPIRFGDGGDFSISKSGASSTREN
jgi:hypothetical protein